MTRLTLAGLAVLLIVGWRWFSHFEPIAAELDRLPPEEAEELVVKELTRLQRWEAWLKWWDASIYGIEMFWTWFFDEDIVYDLYTHPHSHFDALLRRITDPELDNEVKRLWIRLSQCLDDESYFLLIDKVRSSSISQEDQVFLVKALMYPYLDWGVRFADNYEKENYKRMLDDIASQPHLGSVLADEIDYIKSGEAKNNADYLRLDVPRPRLGCGQPNTNRHCRAY